MLGGVGRVTRQPSRVAGPASGEIDIMEHVGYDPGVIHGTIHTEAYNHIQQPQKEGKITVPSAQDEFNI